MTLEAAIRAGDLAAATDLVRSGMDVNRLTPEGLTPLMIASGFGQSQMVDLLLTAGAQVFAVDPRAGATALHKAALSGNPDVVGLLLNHGAFIDQQSPILGHTSLMDAVVYKHEDVVRLLLKRGARTAIRNNWNETALDLARHDHLDMIARLIEARNKTNDDEVRAQTHVPAIKAGDLAEVERLIAAGAAVNERLPMVGSPDDDYTPLAIAAREGHADIVRALLEAGANPRRVIGLFLGTALHEASYFGHADVIRVMTEKRERAGAQASELDAQGAYNGFTALHDAVWHGHLEAARALVDAGAPLHLRTHAGLTPRELAVLYGYDDLARFLADAEQAEARPRGRRSRLSSRNLRGEAMFDLSRRTLLVDSGAAAMTSAVPVFAQAAVMPPVRMVRANGINLAIYEAGSGPAVVLLHGFPGLAFTWRHQVPALAAAGSRVIVPDLRGYGQSDTSKAVEDYDIAHLTGDLVGLLDSLGVEKAVFMGHDWGGLLAWQMPLFHQARVAGVIGVNTPFIPHWMLWLHPDLVEAALPKGQTFVADPKVDPISQMRKIYSPDMYVLMFQDGKVADDAMDENPHGALRNAYRKDLGTSADWNKLPPAVANMEYYGQSLPKQFPGHDVLNAQELDVYVKQFERTRFTPAINWYRNLSRNWKAGLDVDQTIRVPSMMVSAANDVVLRPSMTDGMDAYVTDLEKHVVADCWHWTPEEKPEELNQLAISWLRRRVPPK